MLGSSKLDKSQRKCMVTRAVMHSSYGNALRYGQ